MKEENNTEGVGVYLKKMREQRGFSLQDVASKTKITLPYLENLENEDFSSLPNDVFVKGFLRSYAKVLGLKELDVLERFQNWKILHEIPSSLQNEKEGGRSGRNVWPRVQVERIKFLYENKKGLKRKIFVNVFMGIVVVTGGLILFYKQKSSEVSLRDFNNPVVETAPPVLEPLSVAPGTTPAASNSPSGGLTSGSDKDSPKNKNLHLLIQAIDRSWISVVIDNGVTKEFSLRPDDKVSLDAENFFVLNIGNAGGIKITLNGKPVGPFGKKGEIVRGIKLESG